MLKLNNMHNSCAAPLALPGPTTCAEPSAELLLGSQVDAYLTDLLATITPDLLEADGRLRLVVGNATLAGVVRGLLGARGITHVDVEVAAPVPAVTYWPEPWTPKMAAAKEAYGRQLHRAHRGPAHTPPTTKTRKAARRQAKAGRKHCR
ncbi:hypothetical protein [Hymenobacter cheonanensis]|uniref:hypothetical protein n=1 Tax=Hymenobacter sp. CA2-7 TaxID=3063993 RepID=UPI0027137905|nr:hypothetical protein [Hymenobacter sp. CA2-7]MDO7888160.1 hypothetical protein [Hymenobacter sp. CA2-7]